MLSSDNAFEISQSAARLRAGLAICLRCSTDGADSAHQVLALDFAPAPVLDAWLAHPSNVRLAIANRRLASLGIKLKGRDIDGMSLINVPEGANRDVILTLGQANPKTLGTIDPRLIEGHSDAPPSLIDYLKLAQALPLALVKPAPRAVGAALPTSPDFSLSDYHRSVGRSLVQIGDTPIALDHVGDVHMHLFRDMVGDESHMAIEVGQRPDAEQLHDGVLVRVHSSCVTGDIFHSQRCDCGHQLNSALRTMAQAGYGILIYLSQEGRGIGLNNKLKSYLLQQSGLDTVDGNFALGYEDDERDFAYAQRILELLGVTRLKLLTNNPSKIHALTGSEGSKIEIVERIPLVELHNPTAKAYVQTKARRSGHILETHGKLS